MTAAEPSPPGHQARIPSWAGDLLAVVLILTSSLGPMPPRQPMPASVRLLMLTLVVIPAAFVLGRRRIPVTALLVCLWCYAVAVYAGVMALGPGIAVTITAYNVAQRLDRRSGLILGGAAAAVIALLSLVSGRFGAFDPRVFQFAAAVAVATALGDSARSRQEYVTAVTERAERAEQTREAEAQRRVAEERLRIARDLHDTVAHQISVISLNAGVASSTMEDRPERSREALATIRAAARAALTEIGDLMRYLRAEESVPHGDPSAPQPGLHELDTLLDRASQGGLDVTLQVSGDLSRVGGVADTVAYRVIQEGLANAHKHGTEHRASVGVAAEGDVVRVSVSNPVAATGVNHPEAPRHGLGLVGVRERVAAVRGTVTAGVVGDAFELCAALPLHREVTG
ncbi:sensor histidine kinase [Kribbia dieselivorans]|uniref:sensor histidine kinase n=1 Tax=Kribbia dieselivorans TaxID=331526 RepID=UPI000838B021|nr:histidine kinase [Kribbia dieselivorans]